MAADSAASRYALEAVRELRDNGLLAELDVCGKRVSEALAYAGSKGIDQVMVVDQDGQRVTHQVT